MVAGPSGKILSSALSLSRDKLKRAFSSLIRVLRQPPCRTLCPEPFFHASHTPAELTLLPRVDLLEKKQGSSTRSSSLRDFERFILYLI